MKDEIERLRAALVTTRTYIIDQPIAHAIVMKAGDNPRDKHPSLLQVIDAALGYEQNGGDNANG